MRQGLRSAVRRSRTLQDRKSVPLSASSLAGELGCLFPSPQFDFTAPTSWIFGNPDHNNGGTGTGVGDGYFVMVDSISKGKHTIHYGGTYHFEPGELANEAVDLPHDVTIDLTVGKGRHYGYEDGDCDRN